MEGENVGGLVGRPDSGVVNKGLGEGVDALREFVVDGSMRYFFPHVLEVNLPLIILKLSTDLFDLLVDLLAIKVNIFSIQLPIKLIIELFFEPGFEHIKQVTNLSFIPHHNLIDPLCEFPD